MQFDPVNSARPAPRGRDVPDTLRRALVSAAVTHDVESPTLNAAVCDYVRVLKKEGLPPESVVVLLKEAVRRATLGVTPAYPERREATALVERVVKCCIEEYFDGTGSADV